MAPDPKPPMPEPDKIDLFAAEGDTGKPQANADPPIAAPGNDPAPDQSKSSSDEQWASLSRAIDSCFHGILWEIEQILAHHKDRLEFEASFAHSFGVLLTACGLIPAALWFSCWTIHFWFF